jgi:hypothetical protein
MDCENARSAFSAAHVYLSLGWNRAAVESDAGDANTSDSSALGAWQPDGEGIKGKIVEITVDRTTHKFASRIDISFSIKVRGDEFSGNASATFYDEKGSHVRGPALVGLTGARVKL